jgi:hypothetical protein
MADESIRVPSREEIHARMRACKDELAALRKLDHLAKAAEQADSAHGAWTFYYQRAAKTGGEPG